MSERISYIEMDLRKCSNVYGVSPCTAGGGGAITYSGVNLMPSWNDPTGWTGATDPDLSYQELIESNPSGTGIIGRFEYVGPNFANIISAPYQSGAVAGDYYIGMIVKPLSANIGMRIILRSVATQFANIYTSASTGAITDNGYGAESIISDLGDGYNLIQIKAPYNGLSSEIKAELYFYEVSDGGVPAGHPNIADAIKMQSVYFGINTDWPAQLPSTTNGCFNTLSTCQDAPNYNDSTSLIRFSTVSARLPFDISAEPNIESINFAPGVLDLGKSTGIRSTLTIKFKDHRSPDTGLSADPYRSTRDYIPKDTGTFWGKFKARHKFIKGQPLRWIQGDNDQDLDQMETRHYIVESVAGPDTKGLFTIIAKDILKLTDKQQSQAPRLSNGYLATDISDTAVSLLLAPGGVGESEYPVEGWVALGGSEVASFTRVDDTLTLVRGQENTEAKEHKADARVQLCLEYPSGSNMNDILEDLIVNYSTTPSEYISTLDWKVENNNYIQRFYSGFIAQPTSVNKLLNEIQEQTASSLWWDDLNRTIRWKVLQPVSTDATVYDDNVIMTDTLSIKDQPEKRVSQVQTYYGQRNPLKKLEDTDNFINSILTAPDGLLVEDGAPAIREIFSRWIPETARDTARRLNDLILSRYSQPPRLLGFRLFKDSKIQLPSLGAGYAFEHWSLQTAEGFAARMNIQTTKIKAGIAAIDVVGEEVLYNETVTPDDPNVWNIEIETDRANVNIFKETSENVPITDTSIVNVYIKSTGRSVGGVDDFSLDTGEGWPAGAEINIYNSNIIAGIGGIGGKGAGGNIPSASESQRGTINSEPGQPGGDGKSALRIRRDVNLYNYGTIVAGGGGGGGGGASMSEIRNSPIHQWFNVVVTGSGGGGGAGLPVVSGGAGGDGSVGSPGSNTSNGPLGGVVAGEAGKNSHVDGLVPGNGGTYIFGPRPYKSIQFTPKGTIYGEKSTLLSESGAGLRGSSIITGAPTPTDTNDGDYDLDLVAGDYPYWNKLKTNVAAQGADGLAIVVDGGATLTIKAGSTGVVYGTTTGTIITE